MKSVPRAAASESLSTRNASCMKADIAQTEGTLQARGNNGAKQSTKRLTL
jgi:hypothetical protein